MASGNQQNEVEEVAQQVAQVSIDKEKKKEEEEVFDRFNATLKGTEHGVLLARLGLSLSHSLEGGFVKKQIKNEKLTGRFVKQALAWTEPDGTRLMLRTILVKRLKGQAPPIIDRFSDEEAVEKAFEDSGYEEQSTWESDEEQWAQQESDEEQ